MYSEVFRPGREFPPLEEFPGKPDQFMRRLTATPAWPRTWATCVSRRREPSYSKESR